MKLKLKDPWSAITHGVAGLLAIAGAAPLLLKAASGEEAPLHIAALAVFMLTMILLYTASTVYHSVDSTEKVNRRLRKDGSHDDLRHDRRKLYSCLPHCTA